MKRTDDGLIASSMRTLEPTRVLQPRSVEEAVAVLAESGSAPVLVAGGTDVVAQFNEGLIPTELIALHGIDALRRIEIVDGVLRIGSCVTHDAGSRSEIVRAALPGFAAAWGRIANIRVRMTATIGGNIMARRTRYEMPILLEAIGAELKFAGRMLVDVAIPLAGFVAFDYDRTLRPIMTQAVCLRRGNGGALQLRAALGTEAIAPAGFVPPFDGTSPAALGSAAASVAEAAFADFPAAIADPYTTNAYLRRAGRALLRRQLERIGT